MLPQVALVDASHEKFRDLYLKTLKDELARSGRGIDYIVVSHTEPDHSGRLTTINFHVSFGKCT